MSNETTPVKTAKDKQVSIQLAYKDLTKDQRAKLLEGVKTRIETLNKQYATNMGILSVQQNEITDACKECGDFE